MLASPRTQKAESARSDPELTVSADVQASEAVTPAQSPATVPGGPIGPIPGAPVSDGRFRLLQDHGAVSGETVRFMAAGCRRKVGTDYALAVSGISGPGGGSPDKPVGTTWIAVATPDGVHAGRYRFPANRYRNRLLTVAAAVDTLRRVLVTGDDVAPWYADDTWCRP